MNQAIMYLFFMAYILLGLLLLKKKFESETELEKRIWSPLQSLFLVLFWPIFMFIK